MKTVLSNCDIVFFLVPLIRNPLSTDVISIISATNEKIIHIHVRLHIYANKFIREHHSWVKLWKIIFYTLCFQNPSVFVLPLLSYLVYVVRVYFGGVWCDVFCFCKWDMVTTWFLFCSRYESVPEVHFLVRKCMPVCPLSCLVVINCSDC